MNAKVRTPGKSFLSPLSFCATWRSSPTRAPRQIATKVGSSVWSVSGISRPPLFRVVGSVTLAPCWTPRSATIEVKANGLRFHVLEAGAGDRLALFLHGFPELAFSWRDQLPLLAELGYRAWAPDMRGYGAHATGRRACASTRSRS